MNYNRRLFLKNSGLVASGIALAGIGCSSPSGNNDGNGSDSAKSTDTTNNAVAEQALGQFGLQLYTLRDDLPKDPKAILKQVADMGYKQVEGYEGPKGLWWGMSNKEFKSYLDQLGLVMISSHCDFKKDFERKAAEAGEIGIKYLIAPYLGPQKKIDDFKKYSETFNKCGDICKKNGLRFGYHNHGYSFEKLEGQYPQDVMMQSTNPETVDFEMDIYWVAVPEEDPEAWLKKYKGRWKLVHVKDRDKTAPQTEADASVDLGTGRLDFKKILKTAKENGVEYYIVEQEKYTNSTPLKSAQVDADYMKNLKI
ncbi:MAG TPA: sugar phosphate isomerase/epimerase [Flavitalea sp.]|nr:sugar phosphate isomerase/epimerase [Flavitalea sp.]